jgi:hypothetical protein
MQVKKVLPLKKVANELTESLRLIINKDKIAAEKLLDLKKVLISSEGNIPVFIQLSENGNNKGKLFSLSKIRIKLTDELLKSLNKLLGEDSVILKSK